MLKRKMYQSVLNWEKTSLDSILKHEDIRYGFKFSAGNVGKEGKNIATVLYDSFRAIKSECC